MHNQGQPVGYQSITLSTTAASGLTLPGDTLAANACLIRVETANARFRTDGTAATTGTTGGFGILTSDSTPLWIESKGALQNFSAISQTGAAVLQVMYFATTRVF